MTESTPDGTAPEAAAAQNCEAVDRFVEQFALNLSESGLPRMAARVFTSILIASEGRRSAAELAECLRASPAAISGAVRYLVQMGLLSRERLPGERSDRYRISSDVWYESLAHKDKIYARWEQDLRDGVEALGTATPAGSRLVKTLRFVEFVRAEFPRMMDRWREQSEA